MNAQTAHHTAPSVNAVWRSVKYCLLHSFRPGQLATRQWQCQVSWSLQSYCRADTASSSSSSSTNFIATQVLKQNFSTQFIKWVQQGEISACHREFRPGEKFKGDTDRPLSLFRTYVELWTNPTKLFWIFLHKTDGIRSHFWKGKLDYWKSEIRRREKERERLRTPV